MALRIKKGTKIGDNQDDEVEMAMNIKHDELDNDKEKLMKELIERITKRNNFMRLSRMSEPKFNIFFGIVVSVLQGSLLPVFGILIDKILFVLQYVPFFNPLDKIRTDSDYYCLLMLIISIISLITGVCQKFSFGVIGEKVTLKVRR